MFLWNQFVDISMEQLHKPEVSASLAKEGYSDFNTMDSYELENIELLKLLIYMMMLQSIMTRFFKKDPNLLISTIFKDDVELFEDLVDYGFDVNQPDDEGWTPLMAAINRGKCEIVKNLSTAKANLNSINNFGWTPLLYVIELEKVEIVEHLIDLGAVVNQKDAIGWTPLTFAIEKENLEIVRLLSKKGADVNLIGSIGWSPLTYAMHKKIWK